MKQVETAASRIRARVAEAIKAGRYETEAEFLRSIGRSPGYLGELELRCQKDPAATVRHDTARAIAEALGLTVEKLLGTSTPQEPPLVDKYPNRAWAVKSARDMDLPEAAIQIVLRHEPGHDLHKLAWFHRIEAEAESLRPSSEPES